jgi:hypothetical protein
MSTFPQLYTRAQKVLDEEKAIVAAIDAAYPGQAAQPH